MMLYDKKWDAKVEPKLEPWRKALLDAAQYIRECGWCQLTYYKDNRACILGALMLVTEADEGYLSTNPPELAKLKAHIKMGIPAYNDTEGRTKEEVIAVLERVAHE